MARLLKFLENDDLAEIKIIVQGPIAFWYKKGDAYIKFYAGPLKGMHRLDQAAHRFLHLLQGIADLRPTRNTSWFYQQNFHRDDLHR